jgi:hypothetical protein
VITTVTGVGTPPALACARVRAGESGQRDDWAYLIFRNVPVQGERTRELQTAG